MSNRQNRARKCALKDKIVAATQNEKKIKKARKPLFAQYKIKRLS